MFCNARNVHGFKNNKHISNVFRTSNLFIFVVGILLYLFILAYSLTKGKQKHQIDLNAKFNFFF